MGVSMRSGQIALLSSIFLSCFASELLHFQCADELVDSVLRTASRDNYADDRKCPLVEWLDSAEVDDGSVDKKGEISFTILDFEHTMNL